MEKSNSRHQKFNYSKESLPTFLTKEKFQELPDDMQEYFVYSSRILHTLKTRFLPDDTVADYVHQAKIVTALLTSYLHLCEYENVPTATINPIGASDFVEGYFLLLSNCLLCLWGPRCRQLVAFTFIVNVFLGQK